MKDLRLILVTPGSILRAGKFKDLKMKKLFAVVILGFSVTQVNADALPMEPGMWESTYNMQNPMTGQMQTNTSKECFRESEFDPQRLLPDASGCAVTQSDLAGDTLTFVLECNMEGAEVSMTGVYTSTGDTGEGTTEMTMSFGGQSFTSNGSFTARRLGNC